VLALLLCMHSAVAGRWIARFAPLALHAGIAADATPELYPIMRAEVVSVAIGYAVSQRVGLAVGTQLSEPFLVPAFRFTYPPLYVFGTYGVLPGEALAQPVVSLFAGLGLQQSGEVIPHPYARTGARAEWHLGLFSPTVEVSYWLGLGATLTAGVGIGGWRTLGHTDVAVEP
jgi:hypothetical protein